MRPRADAARNAARLIAAARDAFLAGGDKVPLERIATIAGVGIGTLHRHFPSRDHLAEAVYRSDLDELIAGVPELISKTSALEALQIWLSRYIDVARSLDLSHLETHRWSARLLYLCRICRRLH
ncbi:helix-turn-helix domain-containing protein [Neorhizobium galegae]|uniref:TetR/AcrR family transcriptional regulator n=1 Tax=Neorhizobium galegae TaxID=399 RepID=UPI001AE1B60E